MSRRFSGSTGISQTPFFYGQLGHYYTNPHRAVSQPSDRCHSTSEADDCGIYPFSTYRRVEFSGGLVDFREEYADPQLQFYADEWQQQQFGTTLFNKGLMMPLGVSFIQETTVFREYGPLSGSTMRLSYEGAPKVGNSLTRQTTDADARYYMRIGANGVFAVRAYGFKSWGNAPGYTFFGGNSEMRGYDYREFLGLKVLPMQSRFPLINAMANPSVSWRHRGGSLQRRRGGYAGAFQIGQLRTHLRRLSPRRTTSSRPAQRSEGFGRRRPSAYGIGRALPWVPCEFDWSLGRCHKPWETCLCRQREGTAPGCAGAGSRLIGYDFRVNRTGTRIKN